MSNNSDEESDTARHKSDGRAPLSEVQVYEQEAKANIETTAKLFQDINMNAALLEKLKSELVAVKTQFAENQMELANVSCRQQATNESLKLKKRRETQVNEVGKIVPGLIKLAIEESSEDHKQIVAREILNFEELAMVIKHAVVSEHNLRLEFTFKEENNSKADPKIKNIKRGFDFGISKITNLITKVKHSFDLSYEELRAKPHLIEPDDGNVRMLEDEIIDSKELYKENAKKVADKFLMTKFFPIEIRTKIWMTLIENKHRISPKLYKYYVEAVDKKLKENEAFGSLA